MELCDTPDCARVTHRWEADGERLRVPEALSAGVHFWRATERREGRFVGAPGPVWEFVVPERPGAAGSPVGPLPDLNRDGVADRFELVTPPGATHFNTRELRVYLGVATGGERPAQVVTIPGYNTSPRPETVVSYGPAVAPIYAGDVNGDGYGDIVYSFHTPEWIGVPPDVLGRAFYGVAAGIDTNDVLVSIGDLYLSFAIWRTPVDDLDGDGFADLTDEHRRTLYGGLATERGWSLTGRSCEPSPTTEPLAGDFDADGVSEVVDAACPGGSAFAVVSYLGAGRRAPRPFVTLSGCGLRPLSAEQWTRDVRVADEDGDGDDDLVVWTGATPTARVVFSGGPDGLMDGRCASLP